MMFIPKKVAAILTITGLSVLMQIPTAHAVGNRYIRCQQYDDRTAVGSNYIVELLLNPEQHSGSLTVYKVIEIKPRILDLYVSKIKIGKTYVYRKSQVLTLGSSQVAQFASLQGIQHEYFDYLGHQIQEQVSVQQGQHQIQLTEFIDQTPRKSLRHNLAHFSLKFDDTDYDFVSCSPDYY